jgi:hypothetical protein
VAQQLAQLRQVQPQEFEQQVLVLPLLEQQLRQR